MVKDWVKCYCISWHEELISTPLSVPQVFSIGVVGLWISLELYWSCRSLNLKLWKCLLQYNWWQYWNVLALGRGSPFLFSRCISFPFFLTFFQESNDLTLSNFPACWPVRCCRASLCSFNGFFRFALLILYCMVTIVGSDCPFSWWYVLEIPFIFHSLSPAFCYQLSNMRMLILSMPRISVSYLYFIWKILLEAKGTEFSSIKLTTSNYCCRNTHNVVGSRNLQDHAFTGGLFY